MGKSLFHLLAIFVAEKSKIIDKKVSKGHINHLSAKCLLFKFPDLVDLKMFLFMLKVKLTIFSLFSNQLWQKTLEIISSKFLLHEQLGPRARFQFKA